MHPDLANFLAQTEEIKDLASQVLSGISNSKANWKPGPRKWSVTEHAAHLVKIGNLYLPVLDRMIEEGRRRELRSEERVRYGWLGRYLIGTMEPPVTMKMPTLKAFRPIGDFDSESVLRDLLQLQDALAGRIAGSDGLDLRRIKGHSPATRLMRLSLGEWFAFLLAHERRHLWSMARITESTAFPGKAAGSQSSTREKASIHAKTP